LRLRLAIPLFLLVLVPLVTLSLLGVKVARDERKINQHQFQTLLRGRLDDVKDSVGRSMEELERQLLAAVGPKPGSPDELRAMTRKEPYARQAFVLDERGRLRFPVADDDASEDERDFLERTAPIWNREAVLYNPPADERDQTSESVPVATAQAQGGGQKPASVLGDSVLLLAAKRPYGWITWYWEEGLHLLFWRRSDGGGVIGVEVERIALLSRIVGQMPTSGLEGGRIVLVDSKGDVVYQWGPHEIARDEAPIVSVPLAYPLNAWRLEYFVSEAQRAAITGSSVRLSLIFGLAAVGLALLGVAVYFHREYSRRMRDAAQRVSFVTQVSHELKTPLTNIRLYAELLEGDLDEEDHKGLRRASVIVSECKRLTRLIENILAFSKQARGKLSVSRSLVEIDEVVAATVAQFEPSFAAREVRCELTLDASAQVRADPDSIGQILSNLLSNVEKYGAGGGVVEVETARDDATVVVTVADRGPGIPRAHRDKVFAPFYRASDKLADGVTGTGIGLAIARQLAHLNGGELELVDAAEGARFRLTLPIGSEEDHESPRR